MKTRILLIFISFCSFSIVNAQITNDKIEISGHVTDINNQPIKDVVFLVDNVKMETNINRKGFYKLKIPIDTKMILAFSITSGVKEVIYNGEPIVNFTFPNNKFQLKDGVSDNDNKVDIGYGSANKENLTSSVGVIKGNRDTNYTNIYNMIAGKVPGVLVTGSTIRIRGDSSLYGSNDPLFVVDGIIVNSLDYINPNEVDNISILKGSNTTIYGVRGANGVILINLKKAAKDY